MDEQYKKGWNDAVANALELAEHAYRDSSQEDVAGIIKDLKLLRLP